MQPWLESTRAGLRHKTSGKCGYETIEAITHSFKETRRISVPTAKPVPTANPALCTLTLVRSQLDFTDTQNNRCYVHVTFLLFCIHLDGLSRNLPEICALSKELLLYVKKHLQRKYVHTIN